MQANVLKSDSRQHAEDAAVPVFRGAHLVPYLETLRQIGAPVQGLLRDAKLPSTAGEYPEMVLPMFPTFRFLRKAATTQGIDDLSLRALARLSITNLSPEFVAAASASATLTVALSHFKRLVHHEDSNISFSTSPADGHAALNLHYQLPLDPIDQRFQDWNEIMVLVAIVRGFAGRDWQPAQLSLRSPLEVGRHAQKEFPDALILTNQSATSILVPSECLSLPPEYCSFSGDHAERASGADPANSLRQPELTKSLKSVLTSYLSDGKPPIELAAELTDTSIRTLQRRLNKVGKTYTDLLSEIQFVRAARLLRETDEKIINVAFECGYDDASHFARSFRRIAGVSPRNFRWQSQSGALAPVAY